MYPGLGWILGTNYPIVAVVSGSMEHDGNFNEWWQSQEKLYLEYGITQDTFLSYSLRNGFNKGDIMILTNPSDIKVGDVLVFRTDRKDPIIHRVIKVYEENGITYYQTKGDHNLGSNPDEKRISSEQLLGKTLVRIPFLGWIKIIFVEILKVLRLA